MTTPHGPGRFVAGLRSALALLLLCSAPCIAQQRPGAVPQAPAPPPSAPQATPAPPVEFDKGLFDLRVGDLLTETVIAVVNDRGTVLLPLDEVLSLTGMKATQSDDSTRAIPAFGSLTPAVIDFRRATIRRLGLTYPVAADEAVRIAGTWYLGAERVAELLGAKVIPDMSTLQVFLNRDPPFPAEQLEATLEHRAVYGVGPQAALPAPDADFIRRTGGMAVDWTLSSSGAAGAQNVGLQLGLGAAVVGGALSANTSLTRAGLDKQALSSTWQYTFANPASEWLRTAQFGNAAATTSGRPIAGVVLSNAHAFRGGAFSVMKIAPDAPPGWSYEVYQDGRLIGFSDANARTPVRVQLAYGSTPVEIRFHGPAGEEIRSNYVYQVDIERLAVGHVEYGMGGGACAHVLDCRVAFANVAAGLRSWLTASMGAEAVDSTTHMIEPFGRLLMSNSTGWKANTEWTPSAKRLRLIYFGPGAISGSLGGGTIGDAAPIASYTNALGARDFIEPALSFGMHVGAGHTPVVLRLDGRDERPRHGGGNRFHVGSALAISEFQGSLQYSDDVAGEPAVITAGAVWITPSSWRYVSRTPLVANVGSRRGAITSLQLGSTVRVREHASINAQLQWTGGPHGGPALALTYNTFTGRLRQSVGISSGANQRATTNLLIGSLATLDPEFGMTSSDRAAANTASIRGRAFYDEDGDGVFGPGDRPAAGARVEAAGQVASAAANGEFTILGVLPYEPVKIAMDTVEGIDASYVPRTPAKQVRLSPNVFTRFNIPLVKTREVVGTLVADSSIVTTAGVTVELRQVKGGHVYVTSTFADGTYYIGRVTPGMYTIGVSERSLAALKATVISGTAPFEVSSRGDESIVAPRLQLRGGAQVLPSRP